MGTVAGGNRWRKKALRATKRFFLVIWLTVIASFLKLDCSTAKDLNTLAQLVVPAYTAMNFAAICARDGGWVASQPRGLRGSAIQYAEHVKDEAISSLTYDEAVAVLKAAADVARSRALKALRSLASADPAVQEVQVRAWCRGFVTEFILLFIDQHDKSHNELLRQMEQAKR